MSQRFDRCGVDGRRHVVSVGEAHAAFVKGPYGNWALSCDALARQKRLSTKDVDLSFASEAIRVAAADFWHAVTQGDQFSRGFRDLAVKMVVQFR